jgi:hypothetical protein
MGYSITSIYSIAPDDSHAYFVFYWGPYFEDDLAKWFDSNFLKIASRLGPHAAIVRGLNRDFWRDLIGVYENDINAFLLNHQDLDMSTEMHRLADKLNDAYERGHLDYPFLLVTDRNPHGLEESPATIFYFVPLAEIREVRTIQELITVIVSCIHKRDFRDLDSFLQCTFGNAPTNLLSVMNDSIDLKPNIIGIGLNLNAVIRKFLDAWYARRNVSR